ncbi:MAG: hypothetical protein DLM68_16270 [Hyphomicrobiales bacterium]|nr:MAG: hypothetical protein DLM68_16270 [Hyphomicrobiales bacterium]
MWLIFGAPILMPLIMVNHSCGGFGAYPAIFLPNSFAIPVAPSPSPHSVAKITAGQTPATRSLAAPPRISPWPLSDIG